MWPEAIHRELIAAKIRVVGYVPDGGHKRLIELCQSDKSMRAVVLSTEEEGIGLATGAWLGGDCSLKTAAHHWRRLGTVGDAELSHCPRG